MCFVMQMHIYRLLKFVSKLNDEKRVLLLNIGLIVICEIHISGRAAWLELKSYSHPLNRVGCEGDT